MRPSGVRMESAPLGALGGGARRSSAASALWLAALQLAVCVACSAGEHGHPPPGPDRSAAPKTARPSLGRWDAFDSLANFRKVTRLRSQHLGGMDAEILVNEPADAYPAHAPDRELGPGAILAERQYPPGSSEPSVLFAMVKRQPGYDPAGADWDYLVVAPNGDIEARGGLAGCARCHAEAPHGGVFGPPLPSDAGP